MSANFSISDFTSRINVALSRKLINVYVPNISKNLDMLDLLYKNGLIRGYHVKENDNKVMVFLKYYITSALPRSMKVISTPGKRVYWKLVKLSLNYHVGNFSGFFVISSSKGLITSNDGLLGFRTGGEIIMQIRA